MTKTAALSIRVEPEIKAAAEKAAAGEGRSLANWIEQTLALRLRELKLLKK
jgi:predicted HicB family RNase H-like nuclease